MSGTISKGYTYIFHAVRVGTIKYISGCILVKIIIQIYTTEDVIKQLILHLHI